MLFVCFFLGFWFWFSFSGVFGTFRVGLGQDGRLLLCAALGGAGCGRLVVVRLSCVCMKCLNVESLNALSWR